MRSLLALIAFGHAVNALTIDASGPIRLTRRAAVAFVATIPAPSWAVTLDDDDDFGSSENDEIPDVRSGAPKRKKPSEGKNLPIASKPPNEAEATVAYGEIVAARAALDTLDKMVGGADWASAASLLGKQPLATFEENALTLVKSSAIAPADKKQIGTVKTYGLAADVIIMLGATRSSVDSLNSREARANSKKAKNALDEIIAVGKSNGL